MKKFIAWLVVFGSLLLIWCSKSPNSETNETNETTIENQNSFKWTAKDLLRKWDNTVCSFTFEDEDTKEEGNIYIYEWNMKTVANVFLKKENMNIEAYSITKDDYTYTRSNIQKSQWAKFKNINNDDENIQDPLDEKEVNFTCKKTNIDENMFVIPSDISFIDISDYLQDK